MPDLTVSVISDTDDFKALADEWRLLHAESGACFFMGFEWHYTWWQVYAEPADTLQIIRFSQNEKTVGLLPLYIKPGGPFTRSKLLFLGTGEARGDEVATEYLDVLALPAFASKVADCAVSWMAGCHQWSRVELRCMLDNALLVQAYRHRSDLHVQESSCGYRYQVSLADDEETHLGKMSRGKQKRIKRSRRALERDGGLSQISMYCMSELDKAFKQLTELNHERQEQKQRKSVFASQLFRAFHLKLIQQVIANDAVDIHQFKLGANVLAIVYCFYDENTCYYYQSGFVRKGSNKFMPLTFAHLAEIQRNRHVGRRYYDLMRAEPPSYKEDFGCETTPMVNTFIFCTANRLRLFNITRKLRRQLVALLATLGITRR